MRLAFISILRWLLGPQFVTSWRSFAVRLRFFREFHPRAISVFFAVFIWFLDGIVRIVVFLGVQAWTEHDGPRTQRGAPNSSISLFNFWSKDPAYYSREFLTDLIWFDLILPVVNGSIKRHLRAETLWSVAKRLVLLFMLRWTSLWLGEFVLT